MKSLSKALLVSSLIALLVASAFVSASPVLAENASVENVDLLAGEADVDQSAVSAGVIEAQTGERAAADVASVPEGKSEAVSSAGLNKDNIESATVDEAEDGERPRFERLKRCLKLGPVLLDVGVGRVGRDQQEPDGDRGEQCQSDQADGEVAASQVVGVEQVIQQVGQT